LVADKKIGRSIAVDERDLSFLGQVRPGPCLLDPTTLRQAHEQAQGSIPRLLDQGVRAGQLGRLLADINDRLVRGVLQWVEAEMGPPPRPYCWLLLGSEGRREQTFKTDQDNALIYADPPVRLAGSCRTYFLEFGRRVVTKLIDVGFPPCSGDFMADNPRWVQPWRDWSNYFCRWVTDLDPAKIVEALLFFDLRGIYGDLTLVERLHEFVTHLIVENPRFLRRLSHLSTRQAPPLGFLGHFVLEPDGEHEAEFDLKCRGTMPVVDLARFFALRHGLTETNTLSRLEQLKASGHLPPARAAELAQTFEFMLTLRIRRQWEQFQTGQPVSNYLNPAHLSALDRRMLRQGFKVIAHAQANLKEAYHVKVGRLF
jgi:CBS domain-containing protein